MYIVKRRISATLVNCIFFRFVLFYQFYYCLFFHMPVLHQFNLHHFVSVMTIFVVVLVFFCFAHLYVYSRVVRVYVCVCVGFFFIYLNIYLHAFTMLPIINFIVK